MLSKTRVEVARLVKSIPRQIKSLSSRTIQVAGTCHRFVRDLEPWKIFLTLLGVAIAPIMTRALPKLGLD